MTAREMLRDLKAQRAATRQYAIRARELDDIAHDYSAAGRPLHARKAEAAAWLVRTAAAREAEPEGGA
jgi:hypothetical protein